MRFAPLFSIDLAHPAYPLGQLARPFVSPSVKPASTVRLLARHRLFTRPRPAGLQIFAALGDTSALRPQLMWADDLILSFDVRSPDHLFESVTDRVTSPPRHIPLYRHIGQAAIDASSPIDLDQPVEHVETTGHDLVARIEITSPKAFWLSASPRFTLRFQPKTLPWVYYLSTRRSLNELPRIEVNQGKSGIAFTAKILTEASASASADPVGHSMLGREGMKTYRLVSRKPLHCVFVEPWRFSLVCAGEVLSADLPRPNSSSTTFLKVGTSPAQECLYRVIEF